jgi:hypothetical protein
MRLRACCSQCPSRSGCELFDDSSARARSVGEMVRPSAFAALRLITRAKWVGLLDREVCGLCFLQDLVDVDRGEAEALGSISV